MRLGVHTVRRGIALDGHYDRLYARLGDAISAATSASFRLLQDVIGG
jgi:hypothetical protein